MSGVGSGRPKRKSAAVAPGTYTGKKAARPGGTAERKKRTLADATETRGGSGTLSKLIEIGPHAREAMSPEKRKKKRTAAAERREGTAAGTSEERGGPGAESEARRKRAYESEVRNDETTKRQRKE